MCLQLRVGSHLTHHANLRKCHQNIPEDDQCLTHMVARNNAPPPRIARQAGLPEINTPLPSYTHPSHNRPFPPILLRFLNMATPYASVPNPAIADAENQNAEKQPKVDAKGKGKEKLKPIAAGSNWAALQKVSSKESATFGFACTQS